MGVQMHERSPLCVHVDGINTTPTRHDTTRRTDKAGGEGERRLRRARKAHMKIPVDYITQSAWLAASEFALSNDRAKWVVIGSAVSTFFDEAK
ncbi:hypothetical protein EVAR_103458_1 [Eumeta japonica]|uniref:Uncharacterized protein n=1 Tax=Eumeta variegata TaxID=151549 RepID=A0A4C1YUC9_EUMVA|nr:hypothetical protein EVAR_103458_1 [Eumeta japonica]